MFGHKRPDVLSMMMIRTPKEPNSLYLTYLRSKYIYRAETSSIDVAATSCVLLEVGRKPFPMVFLGTDGGNVIFLRRHISNNVYAWNTDDEFKKSNFKKAHRSTDCRIPLKVAPGFGDIMWLMETNFMDFINDTTSCGGPSTKLHPMLHWVNSCGESTLTVSSYPFVGYFRLFHLLFCFSIHYIHMVKYEFIEFSI